MATWSPDPAAVKALIPTRVEAFDDTSTPTRADVVEVVDQITAEILAEVGEVPDSALLHDYAHRVAALGAAAQVELAFWPEQTQDGTTVGQILYAKYQDGLARLRELIDAAVADRGEFTGSMPMPLHATRRARGNLDAADR